jgi:hypothetical protein
VWVLKEVVVPAKEDAPGDEPEASPDGDEPSGSGDEEDSVRMLGLISSIVVLR